ncbi:hypothetical protein Kpol_2001p71 [Vanderwaltozyma polyspora DSM 70294]|uniref:DNA ligase n=1 Tax=Vanderwaltozyma polyspora (strain ATCC 22028 / DSM 70294 / BCRC 21397 / CBS 2163 / NBRC 10782 / NRRL Y-8283 / UCD 57-17) TaxID=436907 RepID=A7TGV1_VANPO|nr:uncharacterized protein Kpol_2001p71 [Vanderwaltozyma polyspora DSM 70294]EDO18564.1 hypothetical protein Kpol_2001p71 [Vanderwaltozyma polyspora DSM 70294]
MLKSLYATHWRYIIMSGSSAVNGGGAKKQATLARFFSSMPKRKIDDDSSTDSTTINKDDDSDTSKKIKLNSDETPTTSAGSVTSKDEPSLTSSPQKPIVTPAKVPSNTKPVKFFSTVPYADLCEVFQEVESTSSRLSIIKICSDFLIKVMKQDPQNLVPITYLFINKLGPDYEPGLELGLGEGLLMKTISESCGKSMQQLKNQYREIGDLGQIAQDARNVQPTMFKPKPLTVGEVFQNLKDIAQSQGKDSQQRKMRLIKRMLTACKGVEAKFLIRSLESKLRIGLAEKTVLISLSKALLLNEYETSKDPSMELIETAEEKIRDAFCQVPNYEIIIQSCLNDGIMELDNNCKLRPGIPLKPMLAKPTKAINEVLDAFQGEEFTCEYKYDGERGQVHLLSNGEMRIYSRNGENMTERYPELHIEDFLVKDESNTDKEVSLILDCEVVAWDNEQNKILPFQVLSTRKRKGVELKDVKVRVCLFAFDILYYNGEGLITKTLRERRKILHEVTKCVPGEFQYATSLITAELDEIQKFLDQAIKDSCEGLMVKILDGEESRYEPSKRSRNWLKLKKDYLAGVGDSLDLCVMGAYYGKGKRTGTYGGFLLGCYNQDSGEYETCCKIGTGFSDEMLTKLYELFREEEIEVPKSFYNFDSSAEPDIWFEPKVLFEVLTADLSLSPIYKAGSATYDKGISLRFPRFLRIRDDKSVEDATSSDQIIEMYENQSHIQS